MELSVMQPPCDADSIPRSPRRRRWHWLLGFAALLVGVLAGSFFYLRYAAQCELNAILAELDAKDPGWRLEEIEAARKQVPDEQNSALLVGKLLPQLRPFGTVIAAKYAILGPLPYKIRLNGEELQLLRDIFGPMKTVRAEAL